MLLQDVSTLYVVLVVDKAAYANSDARTKRILTAKFHSWMWFVLFKRQSGEGMLYMLSAFYAVKNLFFDCDL